MSDIHALSGAYAVDALDDVEKRLFEEHLAACADCRAEVAGLRETANLLAETTPVQPPASLRENLLAEIKHVRPLPPEVPTSTAPGSTESGSTSPGSTEPEQTVPTELASRRPRRLPALLAAAAAVVLIGGGAMVITQPWDDEAPTQQISLADQVMAADDAQQIDADLPGDAEAKVVRSQSMGKAVLVTHDMQAAPDGMVYQLWLQSPDGVMHPAGTMPSGADHEMMIDGDAATAMAAGITVEPAGGSKAPTSDPIVLFDFKQGA